jgi:hypothetical protein
MNPPSDPIETSQIVSIPFRFHELAALAELANLLDAAPATFRADLLRSALSFQPSESFGQSRLVGKYRSLLWDCLTEAFGNVTLDDVKDVVAEQKNRIAEVIQRLNDATDLARVQLVLCDLLLTLAPLSSHSDRV